VGEMHELDIVAGGIFREENRVVRTEAVQYDD
jgi:hypothetical protein